MKLIIAVIQPEELPEIKEELLKKKIYKFTVSNALGQWKEIPIHEVYRGIALEITLLKKVSIEIAVNNEFVDDAIEAIWEFPTPLTSNSKIPSKSVWLPYRTIKSRCI